MSSGTTTSDADLRPVATNARTFGLTAPVALGAFILALAIAAYPIFSHHFVSVNDVYNHVARAPVLAHYGNSPEFRTYWLPNWRLVPYLGFDLAAIALLPWFSLGLIVKVMIASTFVCLLGGAMILSRVAHHRWSAAALLCSLLLLNRTLLAGFINYLFGIGVCLLGAAAWIRLRDHSAVVRILVLAAFATLLCAVHLFACGVLGVIIVGIELGAFMERRGSITDLLRCVIEPAIAFIPAFLLTAIVSPHPEAHIAYHSILSRIGAFAVPLTYSPKVEAVGFLLIAVSVLLLWATGRVQIDRRLATAAGLLAIVQLMMPAEVGAATVVDHRIPIAFWMVALCAIDIRLSTRPLAWGFAALVGLVLVSRVAVVQNQWTADNVIYNGADRDFASIPGNARVAAAYPPSGLDSATRPAVALYYMPALEFVPKGGFTQILWTIPDQHPLTMRPTFQHLTRETEPDALWQLFVPNSDLKFSQAAEDQAAAAIKDYDYVVFLDAQPFDVSARNLLEPVSHGPGIQIYRVVKTASR